MLLDSSEWVAYLLVMMKGLLAFASIVFLISGLDDLFIDIWYLLRDWYRRFFMRSYAPLTTEQLLAIAEQPIAVMLPAWDESAVIRPMLINTLQTLNYRNYHIFVGVYPNDPATRREVERVMEQYANVHVATCGGDGPTNKADCLNWICQEIRRFEKQQGIRFVAFIMQDSEDVIHPLCYKLINYMFPQFDMVQLPVLSLPRKARQFTGGHYMDEFAQLHLKDLVVRESMSHSLPAAGVGCAFSHRALETAARYNNNEIFSVNSLTEDYDFGLRLRKYGLKQIFVKFFTTRTETRRRFWSRRPKEVTVTELVCIREYFPDRFWASVRQKSRWVLGICLQGWKNLGWEGDIATRYMLYRDRKALLTNLVNMLGYVIVLVIVPIWINSLANPEAYHYPPLVEPGSWVWYVLLANAVLFVIRIVVRAYFVNRLYGLMQALLSFPRMIWGNFINFFATNRAIFQYLKYLRTGKTIAWDKTAHVYPNIDDIAH